MIARQTTSGDVRRVSANGLDVNVAVVGSGPPVMLLHGWPHTQRLWDGIIPQLASTHRVIAPDLRGLGGTTRAQSGYDAATLGEDAAALLDAVGEESAAVVAIDAGVPAAFALAMKYPDRIQRLVLMEALLPGLPGAENAFLNGPPWWFGFHATPGLPETVLVGHEAQYVDWFLDTGTQGAGVEDSVRQSFQHAYTGTEALRCGFEYYRTLNDNAAYFSATVQDERLTVPTMAIGAATIGDALYRQLQPVTNHLDGVVIENCGHIIPLQRPQELLDVLVPFLSREQPR